MSYRNNIEVIETSSGKVVFTDQIFSNYDSIEGIGEFVAKHFGKNHYDPESESYYINAAKHEGDSDHSGLEIDSAEVFMEYIKILYATDIEKIRDFGRMPRSINEKMPPEEFDMGWLTNKILARPIGEETVRFMQNLLIVGVLSFGLTTQGISFGLKDGYKIRIWGC